MELNVWNTTQPALLPVDAKSRQALQPQEEPEFWKDTVPASIGYQYAPILDAIRNTVTYGTERQAGYNPLDDIDGYEQYQHTLMDALNPEHMADLKMQIDENLRRRQVLADSSFLANLGAGIFDPVNLVALPFGGAAATVGRQFLRSGAGVAAVQTGLEVARAPFDPLATKGEVAMNIGSAFVIGGTIGSLVSIPARRRSSVITKTQNEVDEFTRALGDATAEDVALLNQRGARTLGAKSAEELDSLRTSLPKTIEGLQKGLEQADKDIALKKITTEEFLNKKNALEISLNDAEIELKNVRIEQGLRRAEDINSGKKDVGFFDMVDNAYTDSWLYKGVTTPFKRVIQGKVPQSVKATMVKLAGDAGTLFKMNEFGIATPKSVYQYAQTANGEWLQVYSKMLEKYGEHTKKGYNTVVDVNLSNIDGSFSRFLAEANRKYVNNIAGDSNAESEAIKLLQDFYKNWEDKLKEVGLLGDVKKIQSKIIERERQLEKLDLDITSKELASDRSKQGLSTKEQDRLNQLRTRKARIEAAIIDDEMAIAVAKEQAGLPTNEEFMFPRYWNRDAIRERREEFARILYDWYEKNPTVYEQNPLAFEGRQIRNISELSDTEMAARYGNQFNVKQIVTSTEEVLDAQGGSPILGKHVYFDSDKGIIYINKQRAFKRYEQIKRDAADPVAARQRLAQLDPATVQWHHLKFMLDNSEKFKTFNDFQDFVIAHELHHGKIKQKYKEDIVSLEMRVNKAAMDFLDRELPDIRSRQPAVVKRDLSTDPEAIQKRVDETIDEIIGLSDPANDMNAYYGAGKSKHFRHRKLDIPNALVYEFIQNDPLAVMKAYTQRVAPQYEFAKMFGGKSIDDVLDDIDDDMLAAGNSMNEINAVRRDFLHLHDRIVGTVLREPDALDQRAATVLRDLAQLNYLGSAGFSTLPDFAKIMMEHELKDVFKALFSTISDSRVRMSSFEGKLAGEILEVISGESHMRLVDDVTNNPFAEGTYQKYMGKIKWGFYQANLLAPMTNIMKKMDAIVRGHSLIQMSVRVAGGGKKPTKFEIEYLARYGIDKAKAKQIKQLVDDGIIEQTDNGLYLPNTDKWPTDAQALRKEFRSSMNSGIMNTILMGTPADKPIINDGVAYVPYRIARNFGMKEDPKFRGYSRIENGLLGLPFQFYSYTLAAVNKITASYATGQARNRAVALAASMGLAYMGLELKNPDWVMDEMAIEDKIARSFDMSGMAALYSDITYTAMHTSLALGGPDISMGLLQPKFPQKENYADAAVGVLGAGPSIGLDIGRGVGDLVTGNYGEGAKQIMRSMPLARLWLWKDYMNEASNAFTAKRF